MKSRQPSPQDAKRGQDSPSHLLDDMTLSLSDSIAFCNLQFDDITQFNKRWNEKEEQQNSAILNHLKQQQQIIAGRLAHIYNTGNYGNERNRHEDWRFFKNGIYSNRPVIADKNKTLQYAKQANITIDDPSPSSISTESLYKALGWYTSTRLFALRLNRLFDYGHNAFLPTFSKYVLPFKYFGLSYGVELLVDLGVLAKTFFSTWQDQSLSKAWRKTKDTLYKDGRISRMANAAVWFACNLTCMLTPLFLVSATLNLATFTFDVFNEIYRGFYEVKKYDLLLRKTQREINILKNKRDNTLNISQNDLDDYNHKINELLILRKAVTNKIDVVKKDRKRVVLLTTGILIGMVLFIFPPAGIPALALTGAVISFACGSVFMGFGKRIANLLFSGTPKKAAVDPIKTSSSTAKMGSRFDLSSSLKRSASQPARSISSPATPMKVTRSKSSPNIQVDVNRPLSANRFGR